MTPRITDDTISVTRLTSFSDGVFAIAVTLLVFNMKVPQIPAGDVHKLMPGIIIGMFPGFRTYVLSFLLIAVYWTFHHRMLNLIVKMDSRFLWINIFYLLTISFIPFPSALFGSYPRESLCFIVYISSMIVVNILSMLMLGYATYNYRLINKELPSTAIKYQFFRQFTTAIVFLLSMPIAIFKLQWAVYFLFILFPLHWITRGYYRRLAGK